MTNRPPIGQRNTIASLKGQEPMQVNGKPADVCPYCGAGMFVTGTRRPAELIRRYVHCRNCGKRFESRQPPAVIVREITDEGDSSSSGQPALTLVRESA